MSGASPKTDMIVVAETAARLPGLDGAPGALRDARLCRRYFPDLALITPDSDHD